MKNASSKKNQANNRWTLVAINGQGRTLALGFRVKWLLMGYFVSAIALAALILVLLDAFSARFQNLSTLKSHDVDQGKIASRENENQMLRQKLENTIAQIDDFTQKGRETMPSDSSRPESPVPEPDMTSDTVVQPRPSEVQAQQLPAEPSQPMVDTFDNKTVAIEDFMVDTDNHNRKIRGEFKLINQTLDNTNVTGYVFVIAEPRSGNHADRLVYPESKWEGDRPEELEQGRRFSMANFSEVQFQLKTPPDSSPKAFSGITVIVFDKFQELLLKTKLPLSEEAENKP